MIHLLLFFFGEGAVIVEVYCLHRRTANLECSGFDRSLDSVGTMDWESSEQAKAPSLLRSAGALQVTDR
jgi:hypothetical protein